MMSGPMGRVMLAGACGIGVCSALMGVVLFEIVPGYETMNTITPSEACRSCRVDAHISDHPAPKAIR
jgi:hypothetical protein